MTEFKQIDIPDIANHMKMASWMEYSRLRLVALDLQKQNRQLRLELDAVSAHRDRLIADLKGLRKEKDSIKEKLSRSRAYSHNLLREKQIREGHLQMEIQRLRTPVCPVDEATKAMIEQYLNPPHRLPLAILQTEQHKDSIFEKVKETEIVSIFKTETGNAKYLSSGAEAVRASGEAWQKSEGMELAIAPDFELAEMDRCGIKSQGFELYRARALDDKTVYLDCADNFNEAIETKPWCFVVAMNWNHAIRLARIALLPSEEEKS